MLEYLSVSKYDVRWQNFNFGCIFVWDVHLFMYLKLALEMELFMCV